MSHIINYCYLGRHNTYYFRLRTPQKLCKLVPTIKKEIRISLKTGFIEESRLKSNHIYFHLSRFYLDLFECLCDNQKIIEGINVFNMRTSLHILSDLHLEFEDYSPLVETDIVILAGDIHVGTKGLAWAREQFPISEIIYVAGNHEFYHHNYQILLKQFRIEAEQYNIHFLEKNEIVLNGIRFLGCTLWTDYKCFEGFSQETAMNNLEYRLADHRLIKTTDKDGHTSYFSTLHAWRVHSDSVSWITKKLFDESFDGKTVVVTHHGPSRACEHKFFGHTDFAPAFYSDLPNLMGQTDLWVYGHTHSNLDLNINSTRLISNQRGYPNEKINDFKENLKIFL